MKVGDSVRVRRGPLIGYFGKVSRLLLEESPPRVHVAFEGRASSIMGMVFPPEDLCVRPSDAGAT